MFSEYEEKSIYRGFTEDVKRIVNEVLDERTNDIVESKDEVDELNSTISELYREPMRLTASVYENNSGNEIYLRYPELLTVSTYQGYRFKEEIYLEYDPENKSYYAPYTFKNPIKEFDDVYPVYGNYYPGRYKVKLKRRIMKKRKTKGGKGRFVNCGYQYCVQPCDIKRENVVGYSAFGQWETCFAYKNISLECNVTFTTLDGEEIFLSDM